MNKKRIGSVGADIFCREIQIAWEELYPFADAIALDTAERLKLGDTARKLSANKEPRMRTRIIAGLAILLTAIALVPSGAHLFALPNKIGLAQDDYFVAQSLYRGWSLFGVVLIGSLAANAALAIMLRAQGISFYLASAAALCMGLILVIFFAEIYPINQLTNNWTVGPDNWIALRVRWNLRTAINAVITFFALCCVTAASLAKKAEAWS